MDQRSLFGIIGCVLFYLAYTIYMQQKYPEANRPQQVAEETMAPEKTAAPGPDTLATTALENQNTEAAKVSQANSEATTQVIQLSEAELKLENNDAIYQFNQIEGGISSIRMKGYDEWIDKNTRQ